jgi:hypothetical protein
MPTPFDQLLAAASSDSALQQRLRSASTAQEVANIAASLGVAVSSSQIEEGFDVLPERPLSDDELVAVVGGQKIPSGYSAATVAGCSA